jgi:hypothetical protein
VARRSGGAHPGWRWGEVVSITYTPVSDLQLRQRIALDLVELSAKFKTFSRAQIGDNISWSDGDYTKRRVDLLAQLVEDRALITG